MPIICNQEVGRLGWNSHHFPRKFVSATTSLLYFCLSWWAERHRVTNRQSTHLLVYSLNVYKGWCWDEPMPEARNSIQVSLTEGGELGKESNYLSHPGCLPGCALAGSWSQEPEVGIEPRHSDVGCSNLQHKCQPLIVVFNGPGLPHLAKWVYKVLEYLIITI